MDYLPLKKLDVPVIFSTARNMEQNKRIHTMLLVLYYSQYLLRNLREYQSYIEHAAVDWHFILLMRVGGVST